MLTAPITLPITEKGGLKGTHPQVSATATAAEDPSSFRRHFRATLGERGTPISKDPALPREFGADPPEVGRVSPRRR